MSDWMVVTDAGGFVYPTEDYSDPWKAASSTITSDPALAATALHDIVVAERIILASDTVATATLDMAGQTAGTVFSMDIVVPAGEQVSIPIGLTFNTLKLAGGDLDGFRVRLAPGTILTRAILTYSRSRPHPART